MTKGGLPVRIRVTARRRSCFMLSIVEKGVIGKINGVSGTGRERVSRRITDHLA